MTWYGKKKVLVLIATKRTLDLFKALPELRRCAGPCEAGRALRLSVSRGTQAPSVLVPLSGRADRCTATLVQHARTPTTAVPSTAPPLLTLLPQNQALGSQRTARTTAGIHYHSPTHLIHLQVDLPGRSPFPPSDSATSITDVPRACTNANAVNLELVKVFKAVLVIVYAKTYLLKSFHRN